MLDTLSIAKTGLNAQQMQLDIISNNLANVSTTGFKASRPVFQDLLYQTIRQPGGQSSQQTQLSSGLQLGTGVQSVATERLFTQGTLAQTGNQLDLAVNGQGFFQVLQPDGTTSYSRDGSFQLNAQGQVVTASGFPLQPAITIPPGAQSITIGQDGTVSIVAAGASTTTQIGTIQLANFINPAGLQAKGNNLYAETESSGTPTTSTAGTNGLGLLAQGYTESSNVNVVEELVNMIQTQRTYEMNSKAITTADQMLQNLTTTMT